MNTNSKKNAQQNKSFHYARYISMNAILILIISFFATNKTFAQTTDDNFFNIGMQSPTAASLGEYGAIPVGKYTGIPSIKVPLYTVKIGELSLPIELSYHAGGIKADEIAGWVGLGWSLNSGGVITRSMVGRPDEASNGYIDVSGDSLFLADWQSPTQNLRDKIIDQDWDTQPDEFFFNVGGQSGKFMFKPGGSVMQFPQSDFDISYANNTFTLIDGAGVKYTFAATETTTQMNTILGNPGQYTSSWFLSKIESPKGDHEISFNYSTPTTALHQYAAAVEKRYPEDTGEVVCTDQGGQVTSANRVSSGNIYLTSIVTDKETLTFHRSLRDDALHPDSPHAKQEYRLDSVSVAVNGNLLEKHLLTYGYFNGPGSTSSRLRLDSVHKEAADGTEIPPYTFQYNTNSLPIGTTFAVDHWGFFNGATNQGYIPDYVGMGITYTSGADREPNHNYNQSGILEKITYPTGGFTSLVYETNEYSKFGNTPVTSKITYNSETESVSSGSTTEIEKSFTLDYNQEIKLSYRFDNPTNTAFSTARIALLDSNNNTLFSDQFQYAHSDEDQIREIDLTAGTYKITAQGGQDVTANNLVNYVDKTEQPITNKKGGGLRVKQVTRNDGMPGSPDMVTNYKYHLKDSTGVSSGVIISEPNYYGYTDDGGIQGICSYRFLSSTSFVPLSTTQGSFVGYRQVGEERSDGSGTTWSYFKAPDEMTDKFIGGGGWPHQTLSYDWKRGYLTKEEVYDEAGNIQAATIHEYEVVNDTDLLKAIRYRIFEKPRQTSYGGGTWKFLRYETTSQSTAWLKQTKVINRQYDETGTNFTQTSTSFGYDATTTTLQPTTITEKNSDSTQVRVTRTRFAHQEEPAMAALNMLSQPYSVSVEDGSGNVLSKNWTRWSNTISGNNNWNVKEQWVWKGNGTTTDTSAPADTTGSEVLKTLEVTKYDTYGNPLEIQNAAGTKTAYEWSADGTTPVGMFSNAPKNQVYAHSFAYEGDLGDWVFKNRNAVGNTIIEVRDGKIAIDDIGAPTWERDRIVYNHGSQIPGTVVWEFDVQIADSDDWSLVFGTGGSGWNDWSAGGSNAVVWAVIRNEVFYYHDPSIPNYVPTSYPLAVGKTYSFKIVMDSGTKQIDYYINGELLAGGIQYQKTTATGVQEFMFANAGNSNEVWYIDNVRIYPEGAEAISQETDRVFGTPLAIKDVAGSTSRFIYDNFGRLKETFNPNGERVSRNAYYYSLDNNVAFSATDPNRVEVIAYNNPADTTDKTLSVSYLDGLGRPIQSQSRASDGTAIVIGALYNQRGLPHITSRPVQLNVNSYTNGFVNDLWGTGFGGGLGEALPTNSEIYQYYDSGFSGTTDARYAYTQTQFEDSPLARPVAEGNAASALRIGQNETLMSYGLNSGTEDFSGFTDNELSKTVSTDPNGNHTFGFTDGWGNTIASLVDMNGDSAKSSTDLVTEFQYDLRNQLKQVKDPKGLTTSYTYNQRGQLVEKDMPDKDASDEYRYDKNGNLRFVQSAKHKNNGSQATLFNANLYSDQTLNIPGDGVLDFTINFSVSGPDDEVDFDLEYEDGSDIHSYYFTAWETATSGVHPVGKGSYKLNQQLIYSDGQYGLMTTAIYKPFKFTYNNYDELNRVTETGEYYGTTSFTNMNAENEVTGSKIPMQKYFYGQANAKAGANNTKGRLSKVEYRDVHTTINSWGTTWYSYNTQGLIEWIVQDLPGSAMGEKKIEYVYDELGRTTEMKYQAGTASEDRYFRYSYDKLGRLAKVESRHDPAGSWIEDAEYTYFADGQLSDLQLGNGAQNLDYQYGSEGWLDKINDLGALGSDRFAQSMSYQDNGNISSVTWNQVMNFGNKTYTFSYDRANRLTNANQSNGTAWDAIYSYDKNGNITSKQNYNDAGSINYKGGYFSITHDYNNSNRILGLEDYQLNVRDFDYDANGNIIKSEHNGLQKAWYDSRNLPNYLRANGSTIYYTYDAAEQRVAKKSGVDTYQYIRGADGRIVATYKNGALQSWNLLSDSDIIGIVSSTYTKEYFTKDHLGSTRTVVSTAGSATEYYDYYPFGKLMPGRYTITGDVPYNFTGHERDTEAGMNLTYAGARYLDSEIGSWLSIDPLFEKHPDWSPYNYVLGNPLRLIDPDGRQVDFAQLHYEKRARDLTSGKITREQYMQVTSEEKAGIAVGTALMGIGAASTAARVAAWVLRNPVASNTIAGTAMNALDPNPGADYLPGNPVDNVGNTIGQGVRSLGNDIFKKHSDDLVKFIGQADRVGADNAIEGGLAGAIKHQLKTGELVGNRDHLQKGYETISGLKNRKRVIQNSYSLSASQRRELLKTIDSKLDELYNAFKSGEQ